MTTPPGAQERARAIECLAEIYRMEPAALSEAFDGQDIDTLVKFADDAIAQAVQAEREACARIADLAPSGRGVGIADMIRARPAEPAGAMPDGSNWNWPAYGPGHVIE